MLLRIEKQWSLDLDWLMPSLIQIIKWCILNFEKLYCLPGLQQNFGICWKGIVLSREMLAVIYWKATHYSGESQASEDSHWQLALGLFPKSQEKVRHFGPDTDVTSAWSMDETELLSSVCCCSPFPSRGKRALALKGNIFSFLPLATKTVVSSGSTNNYFTSYSWVFVTVFIPYSEFTQPGNKTWMSNLTDASFSYLILFFWSP